MNKCTDISVHVKTVEQIKTHMPNDEVFHASTVFFKALSDVTRTKIIWALSEAELCVCDLAELLSLSVSAISHQLSGLKKDKMVKSRKAGKEVFYSLSDNHIREMLKSGMEHTKE